MPRLPQRTGRRFRFPPQGPIHPLRRLPLVLPRREIKERILGISEQYGLQVDPDAYIWQLSIGEQQRVAILQMLFRQANILILDEPTAVLTPQECEHLFETVRQMTAEGHGIVFISHKLDEVMGGQRQSILFT